MINLLTPKADRAARGGLVLRHRLAAARQKLAVTEARTAGGEPGVMLLLLWAFG